MYSYKSNYIFNPFKISPSVVVFSFHSVFLVLVQKFPNGKCRCAVKSAHFSQNWVSSGTAPLSNVIVPFFLNKNKPCLHRNSFQIELKLELLHSCKIENALSSFHVSLSLRRLLIACFTLKSKLSRK